MSIAFSLIYFYLISSHHHIRNDSTALPNQPPELLNTVPHLLLYGSSKCDQRHPRQVDYL